MDEALYGALVLPEDGLIQQNQSAVFEDDGGGLSSNGFVCLFHLQVVSWVLTSPLVQAPVLVRKSPSNTHTHSSADTQTRPRSHPLGTIKYATHRNSKCRFLSTAC